jgi:ABC-type branched-subunit amino acid transport system substrate-binding protein
MYMKRFRGFAALSVVLCLIVLSACSRDDNTASDGSTTTEGDGTETTAPEGPDCDAEAPEATDIGVTADKIIIEVAADTGNAAAPGLFQANIDAVEGYAEYINENGGIACRDLEVRTWDTKLSSDESKNAQIDACRNALAMVGSNMLFSPDNTTLETCEDQAGEATGLPDLAALAADTEQQCNPTTYLIQAVFEPCPVEAGTEREIGAVVGPTNWLLEEHGDLNGTFLIPGDLPSTIQVSMPVLTAQEQVGVVWDDKAKVSGLAEQSAYTPVMQKLRASNGNYVYNGSNDRAMVNARKEAKAQGLDSVEVWGCSLSCYSPLFLEAGGADVDGTYAWMQFLPFEEADQNEQAQAYLDSVPEPDAFGAQAWQAAVVFKELIDGIVEADGVNGITRASLLDALENAGEVDAGGWMGPKSLRGASNCFVMVQLEGGEWNRVYPEEPGTLDCKDENLTTVTMDPAAEAAKLP